MNDAAPAAGKLEGRVELIAAALALAKAAKLEVLLLTYDFDRRLYGSEAFVDEIKQVALSSERARIKVLINYPRGAMQGSHRLIELGRHLPSRIEFRELLEERQLTHRGELVIVDQDSLLERREPDSMFARYSPQAPLLARERARDFQTLWDESPVAQELRVLGL